MSLKQETIEQRLELFRSLKTKRDVALILGVKYSNLIYFTRALPNDKKYINFNVKKRSGGDRVISAPIAGLKAIQKRLNWILQNYIKPKVCTHGFLYERSIKTNAKVHCRRNLVLNIDLKDFFPSINFGRVRGMFKASPFKFNDDVATILAQICCFDYLPQGAPTSPIISNLICSKLDGEILRLSAHHRCFYTRYADDITFSTNSNAFADEYVKLSKTGKVSIGKVLSEIINSNGFEINSDKTRLQSRRERQVVTGLIVNQFPNVKRAYVRDTRAMIHSWYKDGLEDAQSKFYKSFNTKYRNPEHGLPKYENVVAGRVEFIGMIKGKDNIVYQKLCQKLNKLYPDQGFEVHNEKSTLPLIVTEGSSDRMHLKAALKNLQRARLYHYLDLDFSNYRKEMGDADLKSMCLSMAGFPQQRRVIFIFDNDNSKTKKLVNDQDGYTRYWGNNVYSFSLPVPSHRTLTPEVSIELYYKDAEIQRVDSKGHRLFLSNEFDYSTKKHKTQNLSYAGIRKFDKDLFILDESVSDGSSNNIALSKKLFAKNILEEKSNFDDFDFSEFKLIFNLVSSIINHKPKINED